MNLIIYCHPQAQIQTPKVNRIPKQIKKDTFLIYLVSPSFAINIYVLAKSFPSVNIHFPI